MIHLMQLKCEHEHTILAIAYNTVVQTRQNVETDFRGVVDDLLARKTIRPTCFICASTVWHYDDKETPWETIEEALTPLLAAQAEMLRAREAFWARRN
jgi:lipopolysaccharide biosynthesis glycosyltransferase